MMSKRMVGVVMVAGLTVVYADTRYAQPSLQVVKREPNRLTLQFRGATPALVEVVVDELVIAARHLSGQTKQIQLNLQNVGLAPGVHNATIKMYDAQGRLIGQSLTRIELLPDPNSPLTIWAPRNGMQVAGITPIEVRVNTAQPAYVSFFINGQVRGLRNYPPYVYQWDTTREQNGWHTIEVWSYDGNQTLRTPPVRVYVNNPGGRTERQNNSEAEATEPATTVAESTPTRAGDALTPPPAGRLSEEARLRAPEVSAEPATPPVQANEDARASAVASAPTEPPPRPATNTATSRLSSSRPQKPYGEPDTRAVEATPAQANRQWRAVEIEPHMRGQKLRMPQVARAETAAPKPAATTPERAAWLSIERGTRLPAGTAHFEVVLDATILSFDVAPQVERGVPLLPARQVLEHLGAQLRWDNQRKIAYATLNGREIALQVRENRILVDGAPITPEVPLRITRGRVLLPASALREVLDAEVAYDSTAGQLIISTGE